MGEGLRGIYEERVVWASFDIGEDLLTLRSFPHLSTPSCLPSYSPVPTHAPPYRPRHPILMCFWCANVRFWTEDLMISRRSLFVVALYLIIISCSRLTEKLVNSVYPSGKKTGFHPNLGMHIPPNEWSLENLIIVQARTQLQNTGYNLRVAIHESQKSLKPQGNSNRNVSWERRISLPDQNIGWSQVIHTPRTAVTAEAYKIYLLITDKRLYAWRISIRENWYACR